MAETTRTLAIVLNGEPYEVPTGTTVAELLRRLEIDPETARGIAVAVNEEVVRRSQWAELRLQAGDRVEVVTARQGG
ncbi:sulfur carrier protein ThiS [Rhodothermus marinus]|uniref:sulfur carrier protein ThiS n=1 Tax=Rhodothermus marinus TaxID=29549 RepID=UPI001DCCC036|nr:sulfur carrier protein ThiS [Rhodothermus marinus]MBO2490622.1 sulfur carrier protein ThiS [Rhodothermus marinus]